MTPIATGCVCHFLLTLQLSFRNRQGIVYGYLVPVIFLLAFGSVFRSDNPPLLAHMGQVMTITILGGACFGLPTSLIAERELGVWRRYRLLPVATPWLILSAMLARLLIVASSVLVQLALARAFFGTPIPAHPGSAAVAFLFVATAFLGIGFLIAGLANNVLSVQALGQCIFLPMILIGGVGVPLAALPVWVQRLAGFMPGRYAVELLQPCFNSAHALAGSGFCIVALVAIGTAAGVAGAKLFRWEPGGLASGAARWVGIAVVSWAVVGVVAWQTGRLQPVLREPGAWTTISEADIKSISFDGLPADNDIVAGLAPASDDPTRTRDFARKLAVWPPAQVEDAGQSIRNLVALAAIADLCTDPREHEIARLVFEEIRSRFDARAARQALAWVILAADDGEVVRKAPELGLYRHPPERLVRGRSVIYAQKYLGRLLGKLRD